MRDASTEMTLAAGASAKFEIRASSDPERVLGKL